MQYNKQTILVKYTQLILVYRRKHLETIIIHQIKWPTEG